MGDEVKAGDVLAVFESIDVGMKKNDLIDALVSMKLDKQLLESADESPAIPLVMKLMFRKNVEADQNAIERAVHGLQIWGIPEDDIKALYTQADQIIKNAGKRTNRNDPKWARVELKAPEDGVILESNVAESELIQDPTLCLFQIAKIDKVMVVANAHEDELRELYKLKRAKEKEQKQLKWKIRPYGFESASIEGAIDDIGRLIDPNQHTVPLRGRIINEKDVLGGGQYITATIDLDPPADSVEIPTSALIDDGKQQLIFIQTDARKGWYTLQRVHVTHQFEDRLFIATKLTENQMKLTSEEEAQGILPKKPLKLGTPLITAGLLELRKELQDREAEKRSE